MDIRVHEIETFLEFAMLCNNCIDHEGVFNEQPIGITEGEISTFLQKINHFYP